MTLKALLFDLDDTLIHDEQATYESYLSIAEQLTKKHEINTVEFAKKTKEIAEEKWWNSPFANYCKKIGTSATEGLWVDYESEFEEINELKAFSETYRLEVWQEALRAFDLKDENIKEISEAFKNVRSDKQIPLDGAIELLETLKDTYKLGLVTNGASLSQRHKLKVAGLVDYFEEIIVSGDINNGKPHPEIFEVILKRMSLEKSETLMIGNNLSSDILGANKAGIKAIWLDNGTSKPNPTAKPDHIIQNISELTELLKT